MTSTTCSSTLHPRTRARVNDFGLDTGAIRLLEPLGYREMLNLQDGAALVLTDSGGLQEETTVLGVPCLTLRDSTERPVTVTEGTNVLVPIRSREAILEAATEALVKPRTPCRPEGWDGHTAERIIGVFQRYFADHDHSLLGP
jgi:UDP-N-acetylglucosamine 2-epimerase (non-hydrolysing)